MDDDLPPDPPEQTGDQTPPGPKLKSIKSQPQKRHLTVEQYNRIVECYLKGGSRTIRSLAAAAGISNDTAARAITHGWPERDWPSLKARAEMYDRQRREIEDRPMSKHQAINEALFRLLRSENMNQLLAQRAAGQVMLRKIMQAVDRAVADRHAIRTWVAQETTGTGKNKRTTHRVLREDKILPPYLPELAGAAREVCAFLSAAAAEERHWIGLPMPSEAHSGTPTGWGLEGATPEDIEYIKKHDGKLPPGKTLEDLMTKKKPA